MSASYESTRGARPRAAARRPVASATGNREARATTARTPAGRGQAGRSAAREPAGRAATRGKDKPRGPLPWISSHRLACIVTIVIVAVVVALYAPAKALYSAHRTNAILAQRLDAATSSTTELQGDVDSLMTREGIEDEARRRGYVSEGETAADVDGIDDSGSATSDESVANDSSQTTDEQEPWYVSVLDFVFGYDPATQGVS